MDNMILFPLSIPSRVIYFPVEFLPKYYRKVIPNVLNKIDSRVDIFFLS